MTKGSGLDKTMGECVDGWRTEIVASNESEAKGSPASISRSGDADSFNV